MKVHVLVCAVLHMPLSSPPFVQVHLVASEKWQVRINAIHVMCIPCILEYLCCG